MITGLIIGLLIGSTMGFLTSALCIASSEYNKDTRSDDYHTQSFND